MEWDKNNWTVTNVNYTDTSVCTINFKTTTAVGFAKDLIESRNLTEFEHEDTIQTEDNANIDYRYVGENPNNYVNFNGEKWRIIGVFKTEDEYGDYAWRVKLIRATGLGDTMPWDINDVNEWSSSTLKTTLNGDYFEQKGSYTSIGLNEKARNQIDSVKWYLGGSSGYNTAVDWFGYERGISVYGGGSLTWTGKVGLMYVSDYGYSNASCVSTTLNTYSGTCANGSWIYSGNFIDDDTTVTSGTAVRTWTISQISSCSNGVYSVGAPGHIGSNYVTAINASAVRPVVFLNSTIEVTDGDGGINSAYEIELN